MTTDLDKLLKLLEVERVDKYLFIGRSPKRPSRVFGGQVIAQAVASTTSLAEEKDLPVQVHVPDGGLPPVCGDRDRIVQVVTNLLANAIKFTEKGDFFINAELDKDHGDEISMKISVIDTGIGIPPSKLDTVFQPFTQVDGSSTRAYGGVGVGLTIVKRLTRRFEWPFSVDSEPGRGTRVEIHFPEARQRRETRPQN